MLDLSSTIAQAYQLASTAGFLSGLSIGAVVGFLIKHLIDWYMTKFQTRRSETEKRRLGIYDQILKLVEDFEGNNILVHYRLSHRNREEEDRIIQQAKKEGKDPKQALVDHIVPENKPEVMAVEMRKCLSRLGDSRAESLSAEWAKALEECVGAQMALWVVGDQKLPREKWTELWDNRESAWQREIETKRALMKYLRSRLR